MFSSQPLHNLLATSLRASSTHLGPVASRAALPSTRSYQHTPRIRPVIESSQPSNDSQSTSAKPAYGLAPERTAPPPPNKAPKNLPPAKFNFPFSTLKSSDLPSLLKAQTARHDPKSLAALPLEKQREHTAILTVIRRALAIKDKAKQLEYLRTAEATHRPAAAVKSTRLDKARQQVDSGKFADIDALDMGVWERMRRAERHEKENKILLEESDKKVRDKKMASLELAFRRAKTMALARREVIAHPNGRGGNSTQL